VVANGIPKALFQKLTQVNFRKSDAGPAEAALAIMSNKISYSTQGGDLIIGNKKIEVKSGGKGRGGGRIYNDRKTLNQLGMITVLKKAGYVLKGKSFTVNDAIEPLDPKFPAKAFITECSKAFFGTVIPEIVNAFGTPKFRLLWNQAIYDDYKKSAGHLGILIIGQTTYQYIISGEQLLTVPQKSRGVLCYPGSRQSRDFGIQVNIP